jgi:hypothetical protein
MEKGYEKGSASVETGHPCAWKEIPQEKVMSCEVCDYGSCLQVGSYWQVMHCKKKDSSPARHRKEKSGPL